MFRATDVIASVHKLSLQECPRKLGVFADKSVCGRVAMSNRPRKVGNGQWMRGNTCGSRLVRLRRRIVLLLCLLAPISSVTEG